MKREKQVRTPKQQRSIEKAGQIKKTALQLFSEKGYFKTTTNEIAKNAGLSIGTLYSYYKNKEDIYEELVKDHYMRAVNMADLSDVPADASARSTMYMLIRSVWDSHYYNTAFQKEMAALSSQSDELRAIEQKYRGNTAPYIAAFLSEHGELFRVTDYHTAAFLIQTSLEAMIHESIFYPNDYDPDAVVRELTDMFCAYLVKPEYLGSD